MVFKLYSGEIKTPYKSSIYKALTEWIGESNPYAKIENLVS